MRTKEQNKKYYQDHKEEYRKNQKKWNEKNKERLKEIHHNYYETHKEQIKEQNKKWRKENSKKYTKLCNESRKRRVERLRSEGVTNAWNVVTKGATPKYKEVK